METPFGYFLIFRFAYQLLIYHLGCSYSRGAFGYYGSFHFRLDNISQHSLDCANYRKRPLWGRVSTQDLAGTGNNKWDGQVNLDIIKLVLTFILHRTILVYSGIFTFLVDAYPEYAASALAANSFARSTFAGIFPLFGTQSESKDRKTALYCCSYFLSITSV